MTKRVSYKQREKMFNFMQAHEDFARGRVMGPEAARQKTKLLQQLAEELNSLGSGATKSPDKWLKCWQDWKSDVKSKNLKIIKARAITGGPSATPLTPLEEKLLQFFGIEIVEGHQSPGVIDPLEVSAAVATSQSEDQDLEEASLKDEPIEDEHDEDDPDPLHSILERQAAALEDVAAGMHAIASALQQIATVMQARNN